MHFSLQAEDQQNYLSVKFKDKSLVFSISSSEYDYFFSNLKVHYLSNQDKCTV